MQCNQSFCGNGFTNVPFYSPYNAPLLCNQSIYPEIVGEGEVTSVTLPDGTIQFFFMPTVKWWSTNAAQCQPTYPTTANPMFANVNYNIPPCNNNAGTWFVRSISNPLPQNTFNPCHRNEIPKPFFSSDYNMNSINNGYQVKFHNDNWTSTTDLHYFYPSLRPPCKGTAAVQINTLPANNTMCHYEVVCTKPCNCNVGAKPMSLESLVETKPTTKSSSASTDDCSCDDLNNKHKKRDNEYKKIINKPKNTCACANESSDKVISVDKSITTYTDEGSSCIPADGRETQTRRKEKSKWFKKVTRKPSGEKTKQVQPLNTGSDFQRCDGNEADTWQPLTPLGKRAMEVKSSEILDSSGNELNGGCHSNCSSYSGCGS